MTRIYLAISILLVVSIGVIFLLWLRPVAADIRPNVQFTVDGTVRSYRIVIPHKLPHPAPVVFAFHGTGDSTESMANYSQLDQLASSSGFILVYPEARNGMWATIDTGPDMLENNIDIRSFDRLLHGLADRYDIDRNRVYAVGMSNGGTFAQILAIARSNKIAAVVTHSGAKPADLDTVDSSFPVMLVVGSDDPILSTVQSDAEQYRSDGHVVKFVCVPKLAHKWSTQYNSEVWGFLSQHTLRHKP